VLKRILILFAEGRLENTSILFGLVVSLHATWCMQKRMSVYITAGEISRRSVTRDSTSRCLSHVPACQVKRHGGYTLPAKECPLPIDLTRLIITIHYMLQSANRALVHGYDSLAISFRGWWSEEDPEPGQASPTPSYHKRERGCHVGEIGHSSRMNREQACLYRQGNDIARLDGGLDKTADYPCRLWRCGRHRSHPWLSAAVISPSEKQQHSHDACAGDVVEERADSKSWQVEFIIVVPRLPIGEDEQAIAQHTTELSEGESQPGLGAESGVLTEDVSTRTTLTCLRLH
jgi:hypothetical protein